MSACRMMAAFCGSIPSPSIYKNPNPVHVTDDMYRKSQFLIHMKKESIQDYIPHAWGLRQVSGVMVRFYTYQGVSAQVREGLSFIGDVAWVREDTSRYSAVSVWHVASPIKKSVKAVAQRQVEPERKRTAEEEVALSIVNSVRGAISLGNLRRVSSDNGGVYTLSISVSVNEHRGLSNAKVTGTVKMVSSGEAEIGNSAQMELEFSEGRCCEECGEDISDSPAHFRYCDYCFKDMGS